MTETIALRRRLKKQSLGQRTPKLWLIDLDDTLFEASGGMLHAIHLRMNDFISKRLGLSWDDASRLRTEYWSRYGSTFLGLWKKHRVDPREFLPATHDFDFRPFIHYEGDPKSDLKRLTGKRIVFTNGPRNYAYAVLKALGMFDFFDDVVSSTDMHLFGEWRPKPSTEMLRAVCAREGVRPGEAVMVDDSLMNLKCAKSTGFRTVWCTGYRARNGKLASRIAPLYVDAQIVHIRELSRVFSQQHVPCHRQGSPSAFQS